MADKNEAAGAADAARAAEPADVQSWKVLADEKESGLGSSTDENRKQF
jgi:hypothetical protein